MRAEIARLEHINTAVTDKPIPKPLIADVVVAKVGHIPSTCTKVGFSSIIPRFNAEISLDMDYLPPFR